MQNTVSVGFSIGEVSKELGLATPTLRVWEREGMVAPRRTERGYRIYHEEDVERLRKVKRLRVVEGLNFAAIRQKLGPPEENDSPLQRLDGERSGDTMGHRLRRLRRRARKTLKEVASATGLSPSFISQLERGESGASVASLRLLAEYYDVTAREIFGADLKGSSSYVVRRGERPSWRWENNIRFEELAPAGVLMDPTFIRIPPQAGSEGFYSHPGEEFALVYSGTLFVELKDRDTFRLESGDTLYFPSGIPHRWWAGEEAVSVVWVNTPPTF
jgi:DNA-binding transcriptional MerR regulator/mannose-6-phosphate isomerase-like protein (cupin superfamily)